MTAGPTVTVLIPARNEARDIERCLAAVLAQDHPHDRLEVVVIDGGSDDGTADAATAALTHSDVAWKIVENPTGTTPSNLNAGLAVASGEVLCRVDARSIVPPHYVRRCAEVLDERSDVAVTGGAQVAVPRDRSARAVGIARALNNRFAMGGARYRAGARSGPSDTVYLGAFRTAAVRDAGGWDEYFETNQDYELNRRMGRRGLVWFDDRLEVGYLPRGSAAGLWRQYHRFGRWKVRYWRRTGDTPRRRQYAVLAVGTLGPVAATGVLVSSWRRGRTTPVVAMGVGGGLLVESIGANGPDGSVAARAWATAAIPAVAIGWISGVLRELVSPEQAGR